MSETLQLSNFSEANIKERSSLAVAVDPSATSLTLFNNDTIAANDYLLIGRPGSETAEIRQISGVTGATIATTDAITLHHEYNTPVIVLRANKLKVYTAPNVNGSQPADGAFSTLLATVTINPDQLETSYIDASGSSSLWYKYSYFNSTSSYESAMSTVAVRGGNAGNYTTVEAIRDESGFDKNSNIPYGDVYAQMTAAQSYINGYLTGKYTIPFTTPINPFIEKLTKVLAAGYLLVDQFGSFATSSTNNGDVKIKWVEDQLKQLKAGQIVLTNADGSQPDITPTSDANTLGFSGHPNDNTAALDPTDPGSGDFMFRASDIVGYGGRQY